MKPTTTTKKAERVSPAAEHEAIGALAGAATGAAAGSIAGPPGAIVGGLLGGIVGAIATAALEGAAGDTDAGERLLDETIGVSGGDLGAPNLIHAPARVGTYSSGSTGAAASSTDPAAEGPPQLLGDG